MNHKTRCLLILGWLLFAATGCQQLGLNGNEEMDVEPAYLSVPDPQNEDAESTAE